MTKQEYKESLKELEKKSADLDFIREMIISLFGPEGKVESGIVDENFRTVDMVIFALSYYAKKRKELREKIEKLEQ